MRSAFLAVALSFSALAASQIVPGLKIREVETGFSNPILLIQDPTDATTMFVVQQRGLVRTLVNGDVQTTPFLDLDPIVNKSNSEGGLLGLAFHPNYATNGFFYVNYTDMFGDTHVVRYTRSAGNPRVADPSSAFPIFFADQPSANHNGGTLRFSPIDKFLYIGMGDGGGSNDPNNLAQTLTGTLMGKMLRIDVDRDDFPADANKNYGIPTTNPFVNKAGEDEIWNYGLRNPWKWSFDDTKWLGTGGILIGDVGQNAREEVNYEPPNKKARNYGWRVMEGTRNTGLGGGTGPFQPPIHEYPRTDGQIITGGYVYRGLQLGAMFGRYFFADYVRGKVWSFRLNIDASGEGSSTDLVEHTADLGLSNMFISSIDVDAQGELYMLDYGGGRVLKIEPENRVWTNSISPALGATYHGAIRNLSLSDGKELRCLAATGPSFLTAFNATLKTDILTAPAQFDIQLEGRVEGTNEGRLVRIYARNWVQGGFDLMGSGNMFTPTSVVHAVGLSTSHRRTTDGAILLRIEVTGPTRVGAMRFDRLSSLAR